MIMRPLRLIAPALAGLVGLTLAGCNGNGADGHQAATPPPSTASAPKVTAAGRQSAGEAKDPSRTLDLSYQAEPGQQPAGGNADFKSHGRLPNLFKTRPEEHRTTLSGRLLLDDTEHDPKRAVEGGEVGVQVKTD